MCPDGEVEALSSAWQKIQLLKEKKSDVLASFIAKINRFIRIRKVKEKNVKRMEKGIKNIRNFVVTTKTDVKTLELTFNEQFNKVGLESHIRTLPIFYPSYKGIFPHFIA